MKKILLLFLFCLLGYRSDAQIYASNFTIIPTMKSDDWIWAMNFNQLSDRRITYPNFVTQISTNFIAKNNGSGSNTTFVGTTVITGNATNQGTTVFQGPVDFQGGGGLATLTSSGFEPTNQFAISLASPVVHKQGHIKIPMGFINSGYYWTNTPPPNGINTNISYWPTVSWSLGWADYIKNSGLLSHGYNTIVMNCGTLASTRDVNGEIQIQDTGTPINVTNFIAQLAERGCYFGMHFYLEAGHARTNDECGSICVLPETAYRDGYTMGKWGIRMPWSGGTGYQAGLPGVLATDAQNEYISRAFHAGLYDGFVAYQQPFFPDTMVSFPGDTSSRWAQDVWNEIYVRIPGGADFVTEGLHGWQDAFFYVLNHPFAQTDSSSPTTEGIVLYNNASWVGTNELRFIFGMECMFSMPLLLGNTNILAAEWPIVTNDVAIAIDQDYLRTPPQMISINTNMQPYYNPSDTNKVIAVKQLLNGDVAVAFWNLNTNTPADFSVALNSIPGVISNQVTVVDAFDGIVTSASNYLYATVNPAGLNLYRLQRVPAPPTYWPVPTDRIVTNLALYTPYFYGGIIASSITYVATCPTNPVTAGLQIRLQADLMTFNNNTVTNWPDSSGNAWDATSTTNQPTFITNVINTLPAFYFGGTNALYTSFGSVATNYTMFVVYRVTSGSTEEVMVDNGVASDGAGASAAMNLYFRSYAWGWNATISAAPGWNVGTATRNVTNLYAFNSSGANVLVHPPSNALDGTLLQLGKAKNGSSPFTGYIAEMLYYDSYLSDSDRNAVIGYLNNKYLKPWPGLPTPHAGTTLDGFTGDLTVVTNGVNTATLHITNGLVKTITAP